MGAAAEDECCCCCSLVVVETGVEEIAAEVICDVTTIVVGVDCCDV